MPRVETLHVGVDSEAASEADYSGNPISPIGPSEHYETLPQWRRVPVQEFGADAMRAFSVLDARTWPTSVQDIGLPYVVERSPYEHVRGRFETVQLYTKQFVKMAQVRKERNKVSRDLKTDIYERSQHNIDESLINPIDVAYVDKELLQEYLAFVQKTWGSAASIEDFEDKRTSDGMYFLLIAGHSRHQAVEELQNEHADDGTFPVVPLEAKVHTINSVWDIIKAQIGENISSVPPRERRAIAIVEAYYYGLGKDWNNEQEFLEKCGIDGVTEGTFAEAMNFAKLPEEIRNFVLAGPIPYNTGVQLGLCVPALREHFLAKHGGNLKEDDMREMLKRELAIAANTIVEEKKNVTSAEIYLTSLRNSWRDMTAAIKGKKPDRLDLVMISAPDRTLNEQARRLKEVLKRLGTRRGQELVELLDLNAEVVGADAVAPLLEDVRVANERAVTAVKRHITTAAEQAALVELQTRQSKQFEENQELF